MGLRIANTPKGQEKDLLDTAYSHSIWDEVGLCWFYGNYSECIEYVRKLSDEEFELVGIVDNKSHRFICYSV